MIRPLMRSEAFLSQPSRPATAADLDTAVDLADTLAAHRANCAGMAANMIGVSVRIIAILDGDALRVLLNPQIVSKAAPYDTREGCLSLAGTRPAHALPPDQGALPGHVPCLAHRALHGACRAGRPARDRPLRRCGDLARLPLFSPWHRLCATGPFGFEYPYVKRDAGDRLPANKRER